MYWLYQLLLWLAAPLVALYLAARALRQPGYAQSLGERLGSIGRAPRGGVWVHAVSVGEVITASGLIGRWKAEHADVPVCVSVGTLAGRKLADERLKNVADAVFYSPLDYGWVVRRFLQRLRPCAVVVMETEIWPNLWRESKRAGAALVIVNGRISDKAYPKYRRLRPFFAAVLAWPDRILVQTELYRERYLGLGAPPDRVEVGGNLKYDFRPKAAVGPTRNFIASLEAGAVWVAASTMPPAAANDPDEDEAVAEAFTRLAASHPKLLLVLAPRRPERFETAAALLRARGVRFVKRTELDQKTRLQLPGCLLLDTIGELSGLFALADVVFMGGTLVDRGGHNLLEPAWFGKPIISGPNLQNFPEIAADFRAAAALVEIRSAGELSGAVDGLLQDAARRQALGEQARALAGQRTGATGRAVAALTAAMDANVPRAVHSPLARAALTPLAWAWQLGSAVDRRLTPARRLPRPVISIGGLAMGGAGKTPFAIAVARALREMGRAPAFLTRGYGREDVRRVHVLAAGADAVTTRTGDEARILLRSGLGPVGIAASRYRAGLALLKAHEADVLVLDDGFQHWGLRRDVNIVLLDALDPFGGGAVFPEGRLREPIKALRRADAVVLTRVEPGRAYPVVVEAVRRANPAAAIFRARLQEKRWMEGWSGREGRPEQPVAAFCGLGNPESFWRSLRRLGIPTVAERAYDDHHRYTVAELDELEQIAKCLVTTEKDWLNLPVEAGRKRPVWWLAIEIEIEEDQAFRQWLAGRLGLL